MNYFKSLPFREQVEQIGSARLIDRDEFNGTDKLRGKKIVIVGCGAQGLNQGLNLRDSGLDVSYALRASAIEEKRQSYQNASEHGFAVGVYEQMLPEADLVANLTPDKQHTAVVTEVMKHMKQGATLLYSHGFNIVEEGMQVRKDLTVIMVAPKAPGTEVREEYRRGFGVPTLIAVHKENDPNQEGLEIAKAYAAGIGADRAGVLESSFIAEVKSDLMGEQTILCGMLQAGSLLCFDRMVASGRNPRYAAALVQYGWETLTEALKQGGITNMMDRLSNPAKIMAFDLAEELKSILADLSIQHMDDIMSGKFSQTMMEDWDNDDEKLLAWREATGETPFEQVKAQDEEIPEQEFFDNGVLMAAMIKAGVELAFETMIKTGIREESAYYESLHELPLIANLISRKKLYEMNRIVSDTAEFGCYLFAHVAVPLLGDFIERMDDDVIGLPFAEGRTHVDNRELISVNEQIRNHPIEIVGKRLRTFMQGMKSLR